MSADKSPQGRPSLTYTVVKNGDYLSDRLGDGPCCTYRVLRRPIRWIAFGYCLRLAFAARDGRPGMASFLHNETQFYAVTFFELMGRGESRLDNGQRAGLEDTENCATIGR
jgi:hypothetical protein